MCGLVITTVNWPQDEIVESQTYQAEWGKGKQKKQYNTFVEAIGSNAYCTEVFYRQKAANLWPSVPSQVPSKLNYKKKTKLVVDDQTNNVPQTSSTLATTNVDCFAKKNQPDAENTMLRLNIEEYKKQNDQQRLRYEEIVKQLRKESEEKDKLIAHLTCNLLFIYFLSLITLIYFYFTNIILSLKKQTLNRAIKQKG